MTIMTILKLKELRLAKGWSRRQLAEKLNKPVNIRTIVRWEKGFNLPQLEHLKNLAVIFDVSLNKLFNDEKCA